MQIQKGTTLKKFEKGRKKMDSSWGVGWGGRVP